LNHVALINIIPNSSIYSVSVIHYQHPGKKRKKGRSISEKRNNAKQDFSTNPQTSLYFCIISVISFFQVYVFTISSSKYTTFNLKHSKNIHRHVQFLSQSFR